MDHLIIKKHSARLWWHKFPLLFNKSYRVHAHVGRRWARLASLSYH